jgi:Ca2+-binding EF-hand superfamily protein
LEDLVRERGKDTDSLDDLIEALKVFDSDHDGKVTVEEFKYAMMNMGEKMQENEIEEIVTDTDLVYNNHILIEDFARLIMNRV